MEKIFLLNNNLDMTIEKNSSIMDEILGLTDRIQISNYINVTKIQIDI